MKRSVVLILVAVLAFSLTACSKDKKKDTVKGVDVEYYAKLGKMPECEYSLGADPDTVLAELNKAASESGSEESHSDDEVFVSTYESGDYTVIGTGNFAYYYKTAAKSEGITHIVNFSKAYGYEIGTVSLEIKDALSTQKIEVTEEKLDDSEAFLIPGALNLTCFKTSFGKNTVMFVFEENELCATVIHK